MPVYDLFCEKCDHQEEFFSHVMTSDFGQCPKCAIVLKKKLAPVTSIFRGPGFYATEHGNAKFNNYKENKKEISERDDFIDQAKKNM